MINTPIKSWRIVIAGLVLWGVILSITVASEILTEGNISARITVDGYPPSETKLTFTAHLDGCKWLIRTTPASGTRVGIEYYEWGTDGTNAYHVTRLDPDRMPFADADSTGSPRPKQAASAQKARPSKNIATARVVGHPEPEYDSSIAKPIWFALQMNCFPPKTADAIYLDPFDSVRPARPMKLITKNRWQELIFTDEPATPSDVDGMSAGIVARYKVIKSTNVGGNILPLRWVVESVGMFQPSNSPARWFTNTTVEGEITRISMENQGLQTVPTLPLRTIVRDDRILPQEGHQPNSSYFSTNGVWLSVKEVLATTERSARNASATIPSAAPRWIVLTVITATTALGVLVVIFFSRRKKTT